MLRIVQWVDDLLGLVQDLLADFGVNVSLLALRRVLWLLAGVLLLYGTAKLIKAILSFVESAYGFTRHQIQSRFWRETGKLSTVITFVLLVIAYAFYGEEQERTLPEALLSLAKERLAEVLPTAIVTQWVLLIGFWLLFGLLLGMPFVKLLWPLTAMFYLVVLTAYLVVFTPSLMASFSGGPGPPEIAVFALAVPLIYLGYLLEGPERRVHVAGQQRELRAQQGLPERRRGPVGRLLWGEESGAASRWLPPPGHLAAGAGAWLVLCSILVAVVYGFKALVGALPPTPDEVVRGELVVMTFLFLLSCLYFRVTAPAEQDLPPALFHFVDLSLALSACAVAVAGLPDSPVTLGPVPAWVVAVGPPLVVAALILGTHLRELRAETPRWGVCLGAGVAAALLVGPLRIVLTDVLLPYVRLLPLPDWVPLAAVW